MTVLAPRMPFVLAPGGSPVGLEGWRAYARSLVVAPPERRIEDRGGELAMVERARGGDVDAQRAVVEHVLPHLRAVAHALLGRSADADDAVQIALMRVLENLGSWRGDAALHHWARRVAANACLRLAEQNRRHARAVTDEAEVDEIGTATPMHAAGATLSGSMQQYLDRLPAIQREVVVLRHALGYSVEEVAELTGVALGTVKSRLLGGRKALRKLIRRDDAVDELASGFRRGVQR